MFIYKKSLKMYMCENNDEPAVYLRFESVSFFEFDWQLFSSKASHTSEFKSSQITTLVKHKSIRLNKVWEYICERRKIFFEGIKYKFLIINSD